MTLVAKGNMKLLSVFSQSTRCSCMWFLPLSQVCVCVWRKLIFVKFTEDRTSQEGKAICFSLQKLLPNQRETRKCEDNYAVYIFNGKKHKNTFDSLKINIDDHYNQGYNQNTSCLQFNNSLLLGPWSVRLRPEVVQ